MKPSIYIMMAYHHWPQPSPVMMGMVEELKELGFDVALGLAAEEPIDAMAWTPRHDLYVLKSHSTYWAHMAAAIEAQGAKLLDSASSRALLCSKMRLACRLGEVGLPHPQTWSCHSKEQLCALLRRHPLLLKPDAGARGRDVHVIADEDALQAVPPLQEPFVVQEYHEHHPEDIKAYVIGEEIFGLRKAFGPESFKEPGRPCALSADVEALVRACGSACGVSLYGVDLIETTKGVMIVDVNWFPSFRAVPDAAHRLASHIARSATGEIER